MLVRVLVYPWMPGSKEMVSGSMLIFFDEIHEFADILTWAKFLIERTDYDYVLLVVIQ